MIRHKDSKTRRYTKTIFVYLRVFESLWQGLYIRYLLAEDLLIERLIMQDLIDSDIPIKKIRSARCLNLKLHPVFTWNHQPIDCLKIIEVFNQLVIVFL